MTYSILNFILLAVFLILCAIIVLMIHSYRTGISHSQATLVLLLMGLLGSVILVKSPKYN